MFATGVLIAAVLLVFGRTETDAKADVSSFPFFGGFNILRNCKDVQTFSSNESGVYNIFPYMEYPRFAVKVYCDMDTDGGGWTVIQRRDDIIPRQDFYRTWMEYAKGFGNLVGEFWLGLDHIHALADQTLYEIRFDLEDFKSSTRWAKYRSFYVHDRSGFYKMDVNGFSGNAGDSFTYHNGMNFSAKDVGLDKSPNRDCATKYYGGWWFNNCMHSNLNGIYLSGNHSSWAIGVNWFTWHGFQYSLKKTEMKIRPAF